MGKDFRFIDLFCGIGGFHQAMADLGGECVYASDIDEDCRRTYERNYGLAPDGDITRVDASDIPPHDVLCAGFPCQSFSKAGKRLGFADPTKGTLFFDIMRIARRHSPKYMLLENVRNLATHDGGGTWRVIHDAIADAGYEVPDDPVIFSPHYIGIPQHRERVFIMCVRKDVGSIPPFRFDAADAAPCSIGTVLQDDSEIADVGRYRLKPDMVRWIDGWNDFIRGIGGGEIPKFPVWADFLCAPGDNPLHGNYDGVPAWKENIAEKNGSLWSGNRDFVDGWLQKARTNPLFFGSKAKLEWQAGDSESPDIWDEILQVRPSGLRVRRGTYFPALVAITQTSIVGPRRRYLTPRECARLQSFPDTFVCDGKDARAYRQFGNSVNVALADLFARYMFGDGGVRDRYSARPGPEGE